MVIGISEKRLVILFVEGLYEPMRGWIKAFHPPTLQEAMRKTCSIELTVPRNKFNSKPSSSFNDSKSDPKITKNVNQKRKFAAPLDREIINDLRRRLCFYCKGPFDENMIVLKGLRVKTGNWSGTMRMKT